MCLTGIKERSVKTGSQITKSQSTGTDKANGTCGCITMLRTNHFSLLLDVFGHFNNMQLLAQIRLEGFTLMLWPVPIGPYKFLRASPLKTKFQISKKAGTEQQGKKVFVPAFRLCRQKEKKKKREKKERERESRVLDSALWKTILSEPNT